MYLNFFQGSLRAEREIWISEDPAYQLEDPYDFVESVIYGCTSSCDYGDMLEVLAEIPDDLAEQINNTIEEYV
jgi:hypothetical protein